MILYLLAQHMIAKTNLCFYYGLTLVGSTTGLYQQRALGSGHFTCGVSQPMAGLGRSPAGERCLVTASGKGNMVITVVLESPPTWQASPGKSGHVKWLGEIGVATECCQYR